MGQKIKRAAVAAYLIALHGLVIFFVGERVLIRYVGIQPFGPTAVSDPTASTPVPSPLPVPEEFADPTPVPLPQASLTPVASGSGLAIPVAGVRPEQLVDTFSASRSEGRFHDAIDIMAPLGTPVVAAADGTIVKFFDSERGGITIYQLTSDQKYILYYAHLQRRADEISVGMTVTKGATIGYVGDTGNAGAGNYHLHFSIARSTDPKRFWTGTYLNPYPFLKDGTYPNVP